MPDQSPARVTTMSSPARSIAWGAALIVVAGLTAVWPDFALLPVAVVAVLAVWRFPDRALEILCVGVLAVRPSLDIFSERRFGLGPFALNPSVIFGASILLLAMVLAVRRVQRGEFIWVDRRLRNIHFWLIGCYALACYSGVRWYGTVGAGEGIREAVRILSLIAGLLVVLWWAADHPDRFRRGWNYLIIGTIPPIVVALWQLVSGTGYLETEGFNRLMGTFSHPNSLGQYLVPFVLLSVGRLTGTRGWPRIILFAVSVGLTLLIALTYSRTALFTLIAGLVALPLLQLRYLGWRAIQRLALSFLAVLLFCWMIVLPMVRQRFANISISTQVIEAAREGQSENSFTWRLINWGTLISLGREHAIAGHGAGMTTVLNPLVSQDSGLPFNAHDDFVRFFFEAGILGVIAYTMYGVLLCWWTLRLARRLQYNRAAAGFAVVAGLMAEIFLTLGTTELSLNTAILFELNGMLALLTVEPDFHGAREEIPVEVPVAEPALSGY
ncbi:MAG: O-antigen ligase family protein [Gemmatimonadota bacterium]